MAERRCQTCGQLLPRAPEPDIRTAEQLIAVMLVPPPAQLARKRHPDTTRDVYRGLSGQFYLTYGEGLNVARQAVEDAARRGLIVLTWPNITTGSWSLPEQAEDNRRLYEAMEARNAARCKRVRGYGE